MTDTTIAPAIQIKASGARALPESSRRKLAAISRRAADLAVLRQGDYEQTQSLYMQIASSKSFIADHVRRGTPDSHPTLMAERENVSRLEREYGEITKSGEARRHAADVAAELIRNLNSYVARLSSAVAGKETKAPDLSGGHTHALEKVRAKIGAARSKIEDAREALIPAAEAMQIVADFVDNLAEKGRPDVFPTLEARISPEFPLVSMQGLGGEVMSGRDPVAILAWLFPAEMKAALSREIDKCSEGAEGLSTGERRNRIAAGARELLAAEREEESIIAAAEAVGFFIPRRPDADPRAVLELDDGAQASKRL